jgi:sodium pump decarboxylase gamma subunit
MLNEGLGLMVAGMGVVFAFLFLLVIAMQLSAKFFEVFKDYFPEELPQVKAVTGTVLAQSNDKLAEIAVAIAAVKAYARN